MKGRLVLVIAGALALSACGVGDFDLDEEKFGQRVDLVIVEASEAEPASVDGRCVVFMPKIPAEAAFNYTEEPTVSWFRHLGYSVIDCLEDRASLYLTQHAQPFFDSPLWINRDGTCPPGAVGCYYPSNPTIDRVQAQIEDRHEHYEAQLIGHEIWHAVAGRYHP